MGIHINPSVQSLYELVDAGEDRYIKVDNAVRKTIRDSAVEATAASGLRCRAAGAMPSALVTDRGAVLGRRSLYALASAGSERDATWQMIGWIAGKHGPGDLWSIGPAVDLAADDGRVPCGLIDGVPHVMLRSYYFHDPSTEATERNDPYEGRTPWPHPSEEERES